MKWFPFMRHETILSHNELTKKTGHRIVYYITKYWILNTYRKQHFSAYSEELKSGKGNRICRNLNYESVYLQLNDKNRSLSGTQYYQMFIKIGLWTRCYPPGHKSEHRGTSFCSEGMLYI